MHVHVRMHRDAPDEIFVNGTSGVVVWCNCVVILNGMRNMFWNESLVTRTFSHQSYLVEWSAHNQILEYTKQKLLAVSLTENVVIVLLVQQQNLRQHDRRKYVSNNCKCTTA